MFFRIISSVLIGAGVAIARLVSLCRQNETPRERELYNGLMQVALVELYREGAGSEVRWTRAMFPASLTVLHAFAAPPSPVAPIIHPSFWGPASRDFPVVTPLSAPLENALKKKLIDAKFDLDLIPEEYLDPITYEIMENPVLAVTVLHVAGRGEQRKEHVYDKSTFDKFVDGICPENRQPFIETSDHETLKEEIEKFVSDKVCEKALEEAIGRPHLR